MRRRSFLTGVTSAAIGLCSDRFSCAQTEFSVRASIAYEATGTQIAPDFIGLSYESSALAGGDFFTLGNTSVLGLVRRLGPNGVIRIAGNTSEHTVWRSRDPPASQQSFVLTPASIDQLAAVLRMLGWKLIFGLNLARGTPEQAADEAAYVTRAVGDHLLAFQIGNEPDGFGRWTAVRPNTYDVAAFLTEWRLFHDAIRARVPDARFAGPDVAAETAWVGALARGDPAGLVLLTRHYYADGPAGAPHVGLAKLLRSDQQIVPALEQLKQDSRTYQLPFRIAEANSVYNEGQPGVSDTLGAALWGAELMFQLAAAGAAGINFHAGVHNLRPGEDKAYTPIARADGGRYRAAPLYYGMLMFTQAARGALVPVRTAPESAELRAMATRDQDGSLRLSLINKDVGRDARVVVDPGHRFAAASLMRLAGPSADATTGVTLGGASVDELGEWDPRVEVVRFAGPEITINLPAASAAVLTMGA
ncbi:MAG: hypothetical protein WB756_17960 [Xanthobacteraceae bacterium]